MGWFRDLKTRSKLLLGFGVIMALFGVVIAVAYKEMTIQDQSQRRIVDQYYWIASDMLQVEGNLNHQWVDMLVMLYAGDKAVPANQEGEIYKRAQTIDELLTGVEKVVKATNNIEDVSRIAAIKQKLAEFHGGQARERELVSQGKMTEARVLNAGTQRDRIDKIRGQLGELVGCIAKDTAVAVARTQERLRRSTRIFAILVAVAIGLGILMVRLLNRLIAEPLGKAAQMIQDMSKGVLGTRLKMVRKDEIGILAGAMDQLADTVGALVADIGMLAQAGVEGKLAVRADAGKHQGDFRKIVQGVNYALDAVIGPLNVAAGYVDRIARDEIPRLIADKYNGDFDVLKTNLNKMVGNLRNLNKELQGGFGVLASSSAEILATVSQVAASASEIAVAVSQTSTTAEEVKQTAHLSSQKAKAVQESAQKAAAVSETGRKAVTETVEGMNRIREQMETIAESVVQLSEQGQAIGEIIATVNDLAEQSNLLAVNAAIEATRAGEYGKGFAVVAQEVRSLAEQSRQATTQVRTILMEVQKATSAAVMATEQGSKAVAAGVRQAAGAGESINALSAGVGEAAQAAIQIAASSQQQLVGMDQIASAIANIQKATTQNVAGTRQLEASALDLQELGARLRIMVERQRVEG